MSKPHFPLIGFDNLFKDFENFTNFTSQIDKYPPTDVVSIGNTREIKIAVAGYYPEELSVTFNEDECLLTVRGETKREKRVDEKQILQQISLRNFSRGFLVERNFKPDTVELNNGILKIVLKAPENKSEDQKLEIKYIP